MKLRILTGGVGGRLLVPPSKSHTLRAILFAAMADGSSTIHNVLDSPDTAAMIKAMQSFGAKIEPLGSTLHIQGLNGVLQPAEDVINAGNSGLVLRCAAALGSLNASYTVITGDHSIRHLRPVSPLLEALSTLGAFATSSRLDDHAPIIIKGPIEPGTASLDGQDSQPVSALLIACSFLKGRTLLNVRNPGEKPWIDLTLSWLKRWDIQVEQEAYERYTIPGHGRIEGFTTTIPGDFSSAAYPLAAALITNSELTLENIDMHDSQGDKKLIQCLQEMGALIIVDEKNKQLHVKKGGVLRARRIDVNDLIDCLPILAVIGCFAQGTTEIVNAAIARNKESDRLHAITAELKKMGAQIEQYPDKLVVHHSDLKGAELHSWKDHRIAMSLAVAALGARQKTEIEAAECIAKTYPGFVTAFQTIGAPMEAS